MGKILQKTLADTYGNTLNIVNYTYDGDGNVKTITKNINGLTAIEKFEYDSQQRQTSYTDALGNDTKTHYNEKFQNEYGQTVLQKIVTNPKNIASIEIFDPYGRLAKKEVQKANKEIISAEDFEYDPNGNLLQNHQHAYEGTNYLHTKTTAYTYNAVNLLKDYTRAFGTSNERTTQFTYTPGKKTKTKTLSDQTLLTFDYDALGYLKTLSSSDGKLQTFHYDVMGNLINSTDQNISFERIYDPFGNVLREHFNNGISITKTYDNFDRPLTVTLPDQSSIVYHYDPLFCRTIDRFSSFGEKLYTHCFTEYDLSGHLLTEELINDLGKGAFRFDRKGRQNSIESPFFKQSCSYDKVGNLIELVTNDSIKHFDYDDLNQMTSESNEENKFTYQHDSTLNRIKCNDIAWENNLLDELESTGLDKCFYDLNGNLSQRTNAEGITSYRYDPLNRLIEAQTANTKICFAYDSLDRKMSKQVYKMINDHWQLIDQEEYLYDGRHDIGTLENNQITQLRILGIEKRNMPTSVAIELEGQTFAPMHDCQGNIRGLIDSLTGKIVSQCDFTAFGELLSQSEGPFNPWKYASKRLDPHLSLIDFGKRFYDPSLGRWLTTDPAGFVDGMNLYSFLKNNPFVYVDPDGRFLVIAIPVLVGSFGAGGVAVALPSAAAIGTALTASAIGTALAYASYKIYKAIDADQSNSIYNEQTTTEEEVKEKEPPYKGDVLGDDPTKCPGEGFEWKGKGSPESGLGSWFNESTIESLHPDLNHPAPKKPHWDYEGPGFPKGARLNTDGTWEYK